MDSRLRGNDEVYIWNNLSFGDVPG